MIIVITGPTCLGKSETAFEIAKAIKAEIINGDAFQCYEQMNVGVAKPPLEYFDVIPHHLYSFVDVTNNYSIADYQINLRSKINELLSQNKNIIIVGGSGLYIKSALYDYAFQENHLVDMSTYLKMDNRTLHDELKKIDSKEAEKIHLNNRKRVLRAIEIFLSSGESKSEIISRQEHKPIFDVRFFVKNIQRDELYSRINKRVDEMIENGLISEAKNLYEKYDSNLRAFQAIGYKELFLFFKNEISLEDAIEKIKQNTRNYAKRQLTYIRHQFPVEYYENTGDLLEIIKNGRH